jgi:hypothetical protein
MLHGSSAQSALSNVRLGEMCRLTPECAGGGDTEGGPLFKLPSAHRHAFFSESSDRDRFCGAPSGYGALSFEASTGAREVIARDDSWETPWADLLHLPHPRSCTASVAETDHGSNHVASKEYDKKDGISGATVPLLEMRDIFLGGQFVPFVGSAPFPFPAGTLAPTHQELSTSAATRKRSSRGRAFVPLSTAEEFGGLIQVNNAKSSLLCYHC